MSIYQFAVGREALASVGRRTKFCRDLSLFQGSILGRPVRAIRGTDHQP